MIYKICNIKWIVLNVIKTPGSILRGEINFGLVKAAADVHLSKLKGFKPFQKFTETR